MKGVLFVLKGTVSLGLLFILFRKIDGDQFLRILRDAQVPLLATAGVLYLGAQALSVYRWQVLLRGHRLAISLPKLFSFYLVGMFFSNFLPSSLGGDVVRGWDLYRYGAKGIEASVTIFLDRYTGLVALLLIGLVALGVGFPWFPDPETALWMGGILAAFSLATGVAVNPSSRRALKRLAGTRENAGWRGALSGFHDALKVHRDRQGFFLAAVLISFPIQILNILVYILVAEALGISVSWGYFFVFFPIITVIAMLPVSFNGLGIREGMMIHLFGKAGVSPAQALTLSLTWFFMVAAISLLGGAIFVLRKEGRSASAV